MESIKKTLCVIALFLSIIGAVYSFVYVIKAADSIVPVIGLICIICAAIPSCIKAAKYVLGIEQEYEVFPLKVGDEFTTSKGEHLKVVGFDEDGALICREITE